MGARRRTDGDPRWRLRIAALAAAALGCVAALSLVVANATGAGVHSKPAAIHHAKPRPKGKLVHGFDDNYNATGTIVNLTPYTWTLVETGRDGSNANNWDASSLPKTLAPGSSFTYKLAYFGVYGIGNGVHEYSGFFTYRADAINHSEYLTLNLEGNRCVGICAPRDEPYLVPTEYNSTAAPHPQQRLPIRLQRQQDAQPRDRLDL